MADAQIPIVVVPARNEEALLPRLLDSLSRQTILEQLAGPLEIVVVLNNTSDKSGLVARLAVAGRREVKLTVLDVEFGPEQAHVGHARKLAMDVGSGKLGNRAGVLLTTDAGSIPAANWIEANLRAIGRGADLVGGRIVGDPLEEETLGPEFLRRADFHSKYADLRDQLASLIDPLAHDPWPRHHDHTGASLAVRNDVYRHVGGMEPLPFREDLGFVDRVQTAGFKLVHPRDVLVTVSARTTGRAKGGMADCLLNWIREEEAGIPVLVEAPQSVERRLLMRRQIRVLEGASLDVMARRLRQLGLSVDTVGPAPTVAQLIAAFAGDDPDAARTVPAPLAIAQLEQMIASLEDLADAA